MKKTETLLDVSGMSCGSCVRHVNTALRKLAGVSNVDVRLNEGRVLVEHDTDNPTFEAMAEALEDAGYDAKRSTS